MSPYDLEILKQLCSEKYSDWTDDAEALAACERLAKAGYCRVVWEEPKVWRVYSSNEQHRKQMSALEADRLSRPTAAQKEKE